MLKAKSLVVSTYLRLLAVCYFCAFASLLPQLEGLFGDRGIAPVKTYLASVATQAGLDSVSAATFFTCPSVLCFAPDYSTLLMVTICGSLLSILLFFGVLEPLVLLALYLTYLSIVSVGQEFLCFQWDMLLLEAGFISIFLGRSKYYSFSARSSKFALIALAWLTFRLMFSSGYVKLFTEPAADSSWLRLTALTYHFATQPLPTPLAALAQSLPLWLSKLSCASTLLIEVVVPFFIFGPVRMRLIASVLFCVLQIAIALTGNYGFFNLLTVALALTLVEEQDLAKAFKLFRLSSIASWLENLNSNLKGSEKTAIQLLEKMLLAAGAGLIIFASCISLALTVCGTEFFYGLPRPFRLAYGVCQSWGISAGYGLFASMTRERPELIIEGSLDGQNFQAYEFIYKIGALDKPPPVVAPHMPRLDWQMWFEALSAASGVKPSHWFVKFLSALARNEPCVTRLIQTNPFAQTPPKFMRVRIFNYKLEPLPTIFKTGHWWRREEKGTYVSGKI